MHSVQRVHALHSMRKSRSTNEPFIGVLYKKESSLRVLILVLATVLSVGLKANTPYEIPRSAVVELKESSSGRVYPIFIQVPVSYAKDPTQKYPVIYLTDAHYSFPIVAGATRFPMNSGVMEHAIIVAISYSKGSKGPSSRIRDFTPTKATGWKYETGNAAGHANFIRTVVFPYVEQHYRTSKKERTFVGNSLGGLLGAHILFTQPDMFSSYILGSPSVWFNDNFILSAPAKLPTKPVKVYLSVGELETPSHGERQDMVSGAHALKDKIIKLENSNIELLFSIVPSATHATAFPTTAIQGLHWIYGI